MSDMEQYSNYFTAGMKVRVGIPMPNAEVFLDWAVIHNIDEDLVTLQLSRDQLPVNVSLHMGQILDIRGGHEGSGFSCRAIIVIEGHAREILLRLIGEIVSDELREFYRIDAFLPIKYYILREQKPDILRREWIARREQRHIEELAHKENRWDSSLLVESAELPQELRQEAMADYEDSWDTIIPLAANISGGGIRIISHQNLKHGEYALLEILIPLPPRIVDAVVRVVFANRNYAAGVDHEYYNIAMKFVFINERDRDAIINYISNVQLKRIRQLRENYLFRGFYDEDQQRGYEELTFAGIKWVSALKRVIYLVVFAVIILTFYSYFNSYMNDHPKNEIEEIFEGGIKNYLKNMNR
jgi:hypothetical protein